MAAVDADKISEVLRERYDWINLVGLLKQRYPAFPEDVLARVVVRVSNEPFFVGGLFTVVARGEPLEYFKHYLASFYYADFLNIFKSLSGSLKTRGCQSCQKVFIGSCSSCSLEVTRSENLKGLKGNQQLIEDVLSVQSCVQMGQFGDTSLVMTPAISTPNTSVQTQRNIEGRPKSQEMVSDADDAIYPNSSYLPSRTFSPEREHHDSLNSPPSAHMNPRLTLQDFVAMGSSDTETQHRPGYDSSSKSQGNYQLFSPNTQISGRFPPGHQFAPVGLGTRVNNNLDMVPESVPPHRQTASGPRSLHSLGSTNLSSAGCSVNLQLMKYNQMKKKVENIKLDVERIRTHVAQEEEELNAKATVAKNPTSRELNRLKEENQILRQELLHMLKELDEFGEPFGDEPLTSQNIAASVPKTVSMTTASGEPVLWTGNRPATRFPYPNITSIAQTTIPQQQVKQTFPFTKSTCLPRTSPPSYEHALSYPPVRDEPPSYGLVTRQTSFPAANLNLQNVEVGEIDTGDNDDSDGNWSCTGCTYINHSAIRNCEMCNKQRE